MALVRACVCVRVYVDCVCVRERERVCECVCACVCVVSMCQAAAAPSPHRVHALPRGISRGFRVNPLELKVLCVCVRLCRMRATRAAVVPVET